MAISQLHVTGTSVIMRKNLRVVEARCPTTTIVVDMCVVGTASFSIVEITTCVCVGNISRNIHVVVTTALDQEAGDISHQAGPATWCAGLRPTVALLAPVDLTHATGSPLCLVVGRP